jgi:hypothetical protein
LIILDSFLLIPSTVGWKNGPSVSEFSSNPTKPEYGTHDWIAEHALDWMLPEEKKFILDNLDSYLYGTELPDRTTGPDAIGDMDLQHVYFNETGIMKDDSGAIRASQEFESAIFFLEKGDVYNGTLHLGAMTHYISDLAVFGNVMNETYWGEPIHFDDYMAYVNSKMTSYTSEFDSYLSQLPPVGVGEAYDAAWVVAYNTTFNPKGYRNSTWMDVNYSWSDPEFKGRCGESLNYAINTINSIIRQAYKNNLTKPSVPQNLVVTDVKGHSINLSWDENPESNIGGYSVFINQSGSSTEFHPQPIANVTSGTIYGVQNLLNETTYYFKIRAYSVAGKVSKDSNIVSKTTLDISAPDKPRIFNLPEITKNRLLKISGLAESGAFIEIYLNNNFTSPSGYANASPDTLGFYSTQIVLDQGENNITARAYDSAKNPSEPADYKIVILDTISPIADAGDDIVVTRLDQPVLVTFNGSNSTDNLGIITNYSWTLDLKTKLVKLFGLSQSYSFDTAGEYTLTLNVTDQINNWATDQVTVKIIQLDYLPPYIKTYFPEKDATNQSINVTIKATINEPLESTSIKIKLISNLTGELELPSGDYDPQDRQISLKPFSNLTFGTQFTVIINATDSAGNYLIGGRWDFFTGPRPLDFDGDNIPDEWEFKYPELDPNASDAMADPDNDKLTNLEEYNDGINSTDPTNFDTDSDGMSDFYERIYSLKPLDPSDADLDPDGDSYSNLEEYQKDSNPLDPKEPEDKRGKSESDDYYWWVAIALVIIFIVLLLLFLVVRKVPYKGPSSDEPKKDDDGYLKTKDAQELGVGGNIFFEDPVNYAVGDKFIRPGYKPEDHGAGVKDQASQDKPTPADILARAKSEERKCPACGAGLPKDTTYCFECGKTLDEEK